MTDQEIIERNARKSISFCLNARRIEIAAAKEARRRGYWKRHRNARRAAHTQALLMRRWVNHGAWSYWHHNDPRAIKARAETESIWISTTRFLEKYAAQPNGAIV